MTKDERQRVTLRLPQKLFSIIKSSAEDTGVSVNAQTVRILWDWVGNNSDERKEG